LHEFLSNFSLLTCSKWYVCYYWTSQLIIIHLIPITVSYYLFK
jgi:hypothetical protein